VMERGAGCYMRFTAHPVPEGCLILSFPPYCPVQVTGRCGRRCTGRSGIVVTRENTTSVLLTFVRDGSVEGFCTEVTIGSSTVFRNSHAIPTE
jgi:hypothetical protein